MTLFEYTRPETVTYFMFSSIQGRPNDETGWRGYSGQVCEVQLLQKLI